MDNILDHVVVQGQRYDIVSPTAFGDYIETIGSACINPDGYAQGSTFLARLGNEQFYYEATAAITQGSTISEGTNCKKTTVTGREAELAEYVDSLNEALTNVNANQFANGCVNLLKNQLFNQSNKGVTVTVDSDGIITLSGALEQAESYVTFTINSVQKFPKGRYILSGTPPTSDGTYWLRVTSGFDSSVNDAGQGASLTQSSDNPNAIYLMLYITSHNSLNGIKFKPMITVEGLPNSDYNHYVPYAKTNRELTEAEVQPIVGISEDIASATAANTAFSFTATEDGWYSLVGGAGATASVISLMLFNLGQTVRLLAMSGSVAAWDTLVSPPIFLKGGTTYKAIVGYPSGGSGKVIRLT